MAMDNPAFIHIRPLEDCDIPSYRELRLRGLREFPASFLETAEAFEQASLGDIAARMRASREAGGLTLIAERSNGGFLGLASFGVETDARIRHRAHVWGVYVVPEAQGLGIGRMLMRDLVQRAAADSKLEILLLSVVSSNTAAVRLYTSAGFTVYGTDIGAMRHDGMLIDEYLMRRDLRETSST
jgi:ribosomal protein S18 acetylase RimI-like enzyme